MSIDTLLKKNKNTIETITEILIVSIKTLQNVLLFWVLFQQELLFYWLLDYIPPIECIKYIIVYIKTNTTAIITHKSITFSIVLGEVLLLLLCFTILMLLLLLQNYWISQERFVYLVNY